MKLEIVSHCWNYSRLLTYHLSSFVLFPVNNVQVKMTVFYCEEDRRTCDVLDYFGDKSIHNITWNWRAQETPLLLRRAIGRNMAALETDSDWIFFSDCDQVFREGCIDSFCEITSIGEDIRMVYPQYVNCSKYIAADDLLLKKADDGPAVLDINPDDFAPRLHTRASGGVQIARSDVVREIGYCKDIDKYMSPDSRFRRDLGDRAFRKLIGSQGTPVDIPNMYRIEHIQKGRRWFSWKNKL